MSLKTESVAEAVEANTQAASECRPADDRYTLRLPQDSSQRRAWAEKTVQSDAAAGRRQVLLGWVCLIALVVCPVLFLATNFAADLLPAGLVASAWVVYVCCLVVAVLTVAGTFHLAGRRPTGVAMANALYFLGEIDSEQAAEQIRRAEELAA